MKNLNALARIFGIPPAVLKQPIRANYKTMDRRSFFQSVITAGVGGLILPSSVLVVPNDSQDIITKPKIFDGQLLRFRDNWSITMKAMYYSLDIDDITADEELMYSFLSKRVLIECWLLNSNSDHILVGNFYLTEVNYNVGLGYINKANLKLESSGKIKKIPCL